jgi:hypothetical protein
MERDWACLLRFGPGHGNETKAVVSDVVREYSVNHATAVDRRRNRGGHDV